MTEGPAGAVGVVRRVETAEPVEVRLVVVESTGVELVESPTEARSTESLGRIVGVVRQVEVVSPVEVRLVVAELTEI